MSSCFGTAFAQGNLTTSEEFAQIGRTISELQRALANDTFPHLRKDIVLQLSHLQMVHDRLALKL